MAETTQAIYDANAGDWTRTERLLLSDFTARPFVLERMAPLEGCHVLDLGCGEGYVARLVAEAGAASVYGVDISAEMVRNAERAIPAGTRCDLQFRAGDASVIADFPRAHYDRVMAVFLFNYLTRAQMTEVMRSVRHRLVPGGRFIFTVPHPCFPYMRPAQPPFFFETEGRSYFAGVDALYEGRIWRRDGVGVPVRCVHKTFADYFSALSLAGFTALPEVVELRVTAGHLAIDPTFFTPLDGYPLHVLFQVEAPR